MKSILLVLTLSLITHASIYAQQDSLYYYQFGEKVYLNEVEDEFIVEFADTTYSSMLDSLHLQYTQLHRTIFQVSSDSTTLSQINDTLCTINPFYLRADSSPFYMREIVVLEWEEDVQESQKQTIISQYNLRLSISAGPLEHYEAEHTLETARQMYETGHFKYC